MDGPDGLAPPAVALVGVTKVYGDFRAVDAIDLEIEPGELFTLLGPSGSGKTTVLRLIAGLVEASGGTIAINGRRVSGTPTHERDIGMVFQSLALFPHMSVYDNIAFPLRMRRTTPGEIRRRVGTALETVRLPDIAARRVHELSGGQQQRVALARALVYDPALLLLDEPLGALDRKLREEMQLEIVRLHRDVEVTIVNVTHDQREALMLSDRIGVMRDGRLEQIGPADELYHRPRSRFVAEFLGDANLVDGELLAGAGARVRTPGGLELEVDPGAAGSGPCTVVLRAESLRLAAPDGERGGAALDGAVTLRAFEGDGVLYEVEVAALERPLRVSVPGRGVEHDVGAPVRVSWRPEDAQVLQEDVDSGSGP